MSTSFARPAIGVLDTFATHMGPRIAHRGSAGTIRICHAPHTGVAGRIAYRRQGRAIAVRGTSRACVGGRITHRRPVGAIGTCGARRGGKTQEMSTVPMALCFETVIRKVNIVRLRVVGVVAGPITGPLHAPVADPVRIEIIF